MKKINLPSNPFKSGVFVLMLGFFVNALAIFMLLTQLMPRSVSAQTTSPTYYQEYWCAGEAYAGVNPSGYPNNTNSGDNAIWQRFKRDCRWRAVNTYDPYAQKYRSMLGNYQYLPDLGPAFDEFKTPTLSKANPLYSTFFNSDGTAKSPWNTYLNMVAPRAFGYTYVKPVWTYMAGNEEPRSLNFSDQSAGGSEANNGFVTEWFVYGRIGVGPMLKNTEDLYDEFGSFQNLLPTLPSPLSTPTP